MVASEVIIIGGGPAGSSCAWMLRQYGMQVLILEKESLARAKPCAGWITPSVLRDLHVHPKEYPFGLLTMRKLTVHLFGKRLPLPTRQYSIRRSEFDSWLLQRTGVPVFTHRACRIERDGYSYVIDDAYRCRFLVGAAGTSCPVYGALFRGVRPRPEDALVITLEKEIPSEDGDGTCRLWFFDEGLPGYAWYVPKEGGYLNVGVGGKFSRLKVNNQSIRDHWHAFTEKLKGLSVDPDHISNPRGYAYYVRKDTGPVRNENAYLVGDAAGLATIDMGEGIGPAVKSGILAAKSIITGAPYSLARLSRFSLKDILLPGREYSQ
ncbi:MAG TPA: NAD(P)/FAD-dependent oxidoreductase [Deltaproteobacteria bacterium]|jgi:flavin-dependent dehydrogenase|nr:NAD(P)/FAD-dependent oxidoreductase [Deltaproteobacteria bacterium]HQJ09593.1 NAD(P)/FAD-dependent oxidoreductase [Deltaproteobacteria bacterium]